MESQLVEQPAEDWQSVCDLCGVGVSGKVKLGDGELTLGVDVQLTKRRWGQFERLREYRVVRYKHTLEVISKTPTYKHKDYFHNFSDTEYGLRGCAGNACSKPYVTWGKDE